jgi:hypothetical protein
MIKPVYYCVNECVHVCVCVCVWVWVCVGVWVCVYKKRKREKCKVKEIAKEILLLLILHKFGSCLIGLGYARLS